MIYNDTLVKSYGATPETLAGIAPKTYFPLIGTDDYKLGYIKRTFAKKVNEDRTIEIKYSDSNNINSALYKIVTINWKVSGPKNDVIKNGILDKAGVVEQNRFEIERIYKEQGVDLSKQLPNPLEFWRGY